MEATCDGDEGNAGSKGSENYFHCILRPKSECMSAYAKTDEDGRKYRKCGMCALGCGELGLLPEERPIDWKLIQNTVVYEDDLNLDHIKAILEEKCKLETEIGERGIKIKRIKAEVLKIVR